MTVQKGKARLGRGLSSLMGVPVRVDVPLAADEQVNQGAGAESSQSGGEGRAAEGDGGGVTWIHVGDMRPNARQPRQRFDQESLESLAGSIRQNGLMQPVIVRADQRDAEGGFGLDAMGVTAPTYELVAGERRWRAAKLAGLTTIPAIVRSLDDRQVAEWALVENLQREDLNPIERAEAFQSLIATYGLRHEDVAERVGIQRATVSNSLRLLELSQDVRDLIQTGAITAGHAKALLGVGDAKAQAALARQVVEKGWSVRMVEQVVQRATAGAGAGSKRKPAGGSTAHLTDLERQLADQLGTRVSIRTGKKKNAGTLSIEFYDLEQFDALMTRLGVKLT